MFVCNSPTTNLTFGVKSKGIISKEKGKGCNAASWHTHSLKIRHSHNTLRIAEPSNGKFGNNSKCTYSQWLFLKMYQLTF